MEHTFFLIEAGGNVAEHRYINIYEINAQGDNSPSCAFLLSFLVEIAKKPVPYGASLAETAFCKGVQNAS